MVEELLTVEQAARRLQLTPWTIREQLKAGKLRGVKRGRGWRIPETALLESVPAPNVPALAAAPISRSTARLDHPVEALLDATCAGAKRAGFNTVEDVDRLIDEVRAELGQDAPRRALRASRSAATSGTAKTPGTAKARR